MATQAEPTRHRYVESKVDPGTCAICRFIKRNRRHAEDADPTPDVRQRQAGEYR